VLTLILFPGRREGISDGTWPIGMRSSVVISIGMETSGIEPRRFATGGIVSQAAGEMRGEIAGRFGI
jgi:hypothetical protein